MGTPTSLSVEVERYVAQIEHLRQIYNESKTVLSEVDYERHFDEQLLNATTWDAAEERVFSDAVNALPKFIVLGSSATAKAAVVNELLGCAVMPVVAAEDHAEVKSASVGGGRSSAAFWKPVTIRYGQSAQYSFGSSESRAADSVVSLSSAGHSAGSFSSVPFSAIAASTSVPCFRQTLDISMAHPLLKDGAEIFVPSYMQSIDDRSRLQFSLDSSVAETSLPIILFIIATPNLTEQDHYDIATLRQRLPQQPIFFIKSRPYARSDLPEADRYSAAPLAVSGSLSSSVEDSSGSWRQLGGHGQRSRAQQRPPRFVACFSAPSSDSDSTDGDRRDSAPRPAPAGSLRRQLIEMRLVHAGRTRSHADAAHSRRRSPVAADDDAAVLGDLIETPRDFPRLIWFVQRVCVNRLVDLATRCNKWHCALLNLFILTAFDMARDQLITPKRLKYAKKTESELYAQLMAAVTQKQDEMQHLFVSSIDQMRDEVLREAVDITYVRHRLTGADQPPTVVEATEQIEQFVLFKANAVLAERLRATLDCLQQTFVGTLSRCLDSVVSTGPQGAESGQQAAKALSELLNASYTLDVSLPATGSLLQLLWTKMKQVGSSVLPVCFFALPPAAHAETAPLLFHLDLDNNNAGPSVLGRNDGDQKSGPSDASWRRHVAQRTLDKLTDLKLSRIIVGQFKGRLRHAHETFEAAIDKLESYHSSRLIHEENQRLRLRKQHAPRLARLTMESMAHRDSLIYGMPKLGVEVGRGQYGVVYSCERFGHFGPCAVKSVVPPDDKHWNDLALEFYYTKSLLEHDRVVRLHGAVIDHNYGGGGGPPAVLLIMERMKRDLYAALRSELSWPSRLQIALDVVEGMRFLHSQGLVHRDIKLKNVLLDEHNRGKVTDLGFCKPEAMMSGSVVGTPIHMAPELFSGCYDSSVDVYAFGVLFWYICAGHVRLPQAFEQCLSKDQLWNSVRKGLRPEQLSTFDVECWSIMRACWSGDAAQRPHLGDIQPRLQMLLDQYNANNTAMMPKISPSQGQLQTNMALATHDKRYRPSAFVRR